MSAPGPADDRPEHLRAILKDLAWTISVNASTLGNFLDLRDDAGADYSLRCLIASVRVARDTMRMLRPITAGASNE